MKKLALSFTIAVLFNLSGSLALACHHDKPNNNKPSAPACDGKEHKDHEEGTPNQNNQANPGQNGKNAKDKSKDAGKTTPKPKQ